jgi:feruloyl esterase
MYARLQTLSIALLSLPSIILATSPSAAFREKCLAFKPHYHIQNSTLNVLEYVAAGSNVTFRDNSATCNRASQVVSVHICRIALEILTSETSRITFEAWFPEDWSGRFLATGNGGIDGCEYQISP